eukprot:scaffold1888_cov120-Cylindrotheca_fusiformis.AAC.29
MAKQETTIYYQAPAMLHPFLNQKGKSPSGVMRCKFLPHKDCPGFPRGVISIMYDIPTGIQASYHPNPGVQYAGTRRRAYIPHTPEGHSLLSRMKDAFHRGYMFSVGKSLTTGLDNQVTWTTIPNKTSLHGGPFGFPDRNYISKANLELDKLGIPPAQYSLPTAQQTSWDAQSNQGTKFPFQAESIHYVAPEKLLAKDLDGDIIRQIPETSFPPDMPSVSARVPIHSQPPIPPFMGTLPLASEQSEIDNMQPAKIVAVDDLASAQSNMTAVVEADVKHEPSCSEETCAICLNELSSEKAVEIIACHHAFHETCILHALHHIDKCPVCRKPMCGKPQGKGPSGSMATELMGVSCPGFDGCDTIKLTYDIPSGVQKAYHDNPNSRYDGTSRTAYLPNNDAGRCLLLRLKYAFRNGLTFRIGTSLTTGQKNQVTWTSIHHKTCLSGGVHGFPDDAYISNCNASLDALNVPPPEKCEG